MKGKIAIVMAALVVMGCVLYIHPRPVAPVSNDSRLTERMARPRLPAPRMTATVLPTELPVDDLASTSLIARLLKEGDAPKLTRQQIDSYVVENRRSAGSLLAAFRLSGDKAFLQEAEGKFPNDARVAFAAVFKSDSAAERRQWLDNFKQSAPDNALANYLSALDYFKSGQGDQAVPELLAASGKSNLRDYSMDFVQNAEEAYRAAGYSEAEAKAIAGIQHLQPQLAELKQLGQNLGELANSYRQAGDEASAQAALQIGVNLGQRLEQASSQGSLVQDLVGVAIERQILGAMDPASSYGGAGQMVQDRLNELAQRREDIHALARQLTAALPAMSDQDLASFFEREKVFGGEAAGRWVQSKYGPQ